MKATDRFGTDRFGRKFKIAELTHPKLQVAFVKSANTKQKKKKRAVE